MPTKYRAPLFNPRSKKPFRISRTKFELFLRCRRCFYLNQRCGVKFKDESYYSLNHAVDRLIKEGSDRLRLSKVLSLLALKHRIRAVPYDHPDIKDWLFTFKGLTHLHESTNLILFGAPDDIWLIDNLKLAIIDTKATSSQKKTIEESAFWVSYQRQVEFYTWLLERQNLAFPVSRTCYFIYANTTPNQTYDNTLNLKLDFELKLIPYKGNTGWIEPEIVVMKNCLMSESLPSPDKNCWICKYRAKAAKIEHANSALRKRPCE